MNALARKKAKQRDSSFFFELLILCKNLQLNLFNISFVSFLALNFSNSHRNSNFAKIISFYRNEVFVIKGEHFFARNLGRNHICIMRVLQLIVILMWLEKECALDLGEPKN